ncbi:hypothetical protein DSO57_1015793 [Entomophthora muscae]|uniref:Uncharacterized protein n=1 Tax=Entomophthora muscae TaxID=34485 RepID=A0ACC2T593_9FUNG|nr:hypothetical protein DSO57_1015793 [Entomophthora muscae]
MFSPETKGSVKTETWNRFQTLVKTARGLPALRARGLCCFGIKPSLIFSVNALENETTSVDLPNMVPRKRHNKLSNEDKEAPAIGLMSLMSTTVTNQNPAPKRIMGQRAAPNNTALEQKGCATLLEVLANKHSFCAVPFCCPKAWATCLPKFPFPK